MKKHNDIPPEYISDLEELMKLARAAYKPYVDSKDFDSEGAVEARRNMSKAYEMLKQARER